MYKYENTYCNPIPLPNYPLGRCCVQGWGEYKRDYRETADPTVIYEDGVWYLYPSCGMVYWSEDFIHWKHKEMEPYDIGYAPTVVKHNGKFLLSACGAQLYEADSPTGPFHPLGAFRTMDGTELYVDDPMLFSDEDGRLYLYSGCGGEIRGAELDPKEPTRLITPHSLMFGMNTAEHKWERMGDFNEDDSYSWIEGAWLYKRNGIYYLTYSAPGTEWVTYAMGAYKGTSPLGPWEYMESSPFLLSTNGLIRGTGHGSIVDGPMNTTWVFYTLCVCYGGRFERRIGYDLIDFDKNGDIIPRSASETPCFIPTQETQGTNNCAGLLPLTRRKPCIASSCEQGRDELYATDGSMITWWQPENSDTSPCLTVKLGAQPFELASVRVIWRDVGLSIKDGILPEPVKYKIEARNESGEWVCVLDKTDNSEDMLIDYSPLPSIRATEVRIIIASKPEKIKHGLTDFSIFGKR